MKYKLALKLKKAGFPLSQPNTDKDGVYRWPDRDHPKYRTSEAIYVPTLDELIGECGEDFGQLIYFTTVLREDKKWTAMTIFSQSGKREVGTGKIPSEAVANLCLHRLYL